MPLTPAKVKLTALVIPAVLTACMPGPSTTKAQLQTLTRHTYTATLTDNTTPTTLSALATTHFEPANGADIIYIHGTPGAASNYADYLIQDQANGVASVAIDRPGFGKSKTTGPITSFEAQARAIEPLLPPADSTRNATIIGHSLGGPIAAAAATLYHNRVDTLIIVAGSLDPALEKPRWYNNAGQLFFIRPFLPTDLKTSNAEIIAAPAQTIWLNELLTANWPITTISVHIIHGTTDKLVSYANTTYMQRIFQNATLHTLEDQGHFILWSHARQIRELTDAPSTQIVQ